MDDELTMDCRVWPLTGIFSSYSIRPAATHSSQKPKGDRMDKYSDRSIQTSSAQFALNDAAGALPRMFGRTAATRSRL